MTIALSLAFNVFLISTGTSAFAAPDPDQVTGVERRPVLLELFTSEGCSSCPPADKLLELLDNTQPIAGAELIVLSEHVDYWNHAGWSDPFSSPAFSARQQDYADKFRIDSIYTPQLVIDGAAELVGSNASGVRNEIMKALHQPKIVIGLTDLVRASNKVSAHLKLAPVSHDNGNAMLFVALADNQDESHVVRGENAGRSLKHVAVLRQLIPVGKLSGSGFEGDVSIPLGSASDGGVRVIAFVQDRVSRQILGVAQQRLYTSVHPAKSAS